jgi:hypothetical protein
MEATSLALNGLVGGVGGCGILKNHCCNHHPDLQYKAIEFCRFWAMRSTSLCSVCCRSLAANGVGLKGFLSIMKPFIEADEAG